MYIPYYVLCILLHELLIIAIGSSAREYKGDLYFTLTLGAKSKASKWMAVTR